MRASGARGSYFNLCSATANAEAKSSELSASNAAVLFGRFDGVAACAKPGEKAVVIEQVTQR